MKFKDLAIGERFRFLTIWYAGQECGPWIKSGPRSYRHTTDKALDKVKIGSINVEVVKLEPGLPQTQWLDTYARELADETYRLYSEMISPVLYLYGYTEHGLYTQIKLARDEPKYWGLVILVHVPRNLTTDALASWFQERLCRAPIMPFLDQKYGEKPV